MERPKALDLFGGAGGASMGLHRAGFEVRGVDLHPQPNYPFEFVQADAMTYPLDEYDLIWASPPCQGYCQWGGINGERGNVRDHPLLIEAVRERLEGCPAYVIENVVGAPLLNPILLTGGMFDLGVHRPRLFETKPWVLSPSTQDTRPRRVGVYGKLDGRRLYTRSDGTELRNPVSLEEAATAMGIDWMEWEELKEAIPPAYSQWIGEQIIDTLNRRQTCQSRSTTTRATRPRTMTDTDGESQTMRES